MKKGNFNNSIYHEKLIKISRNSKVVKGGRVFSFSAFSVVGDKKGMIGLGKGKSKEVPQAIKKSVESAYKNMVNVFIKENTIPYKIISHYCSSSIILIPAYRGTGIIASNSIRSLCEVLGVKDIVTKCIGSTNTINVVKATLKGLKSINIRCSKKNK